jgi:2-methylcitrate dehydratase
MNVRPSLPADEISDALAAFCCGIPQEVEPESVRAATFVLLDSFAVVLGALGHPAANVARRYARLFPSRDGALIWGTLLRTSPQTAALVNGVPLRGYDYNDLYIGKCGGGHPSDIVPGVLAVAEWRGSRGRDVIRALCLGYEVAMHLFDTVPAAKSGWDYVNLTALGATCAIASLLGLNRDQTAEAIAITTVPHAASNEIESGDLNRRGDLTMWKRFNGSDAVRHAVYACLLASVGAEGAVRPFVGRCGVLKTFGVTEDGRKDLLTRLGSRGPLRRISGTTFKRWPVGSRAQSAIQAALEARHALGARIDAIREIRVFTQDAVFEHLVRRREAPWRPHSRETADHSLPYIVAAAVLDGEIRPESFDPDKVRDPERQRFLDRVKVEVAPDLNQAASGEWLSRVEIVCNDGTRLEGAAAAPPGHPNRPFDRQDMLDKLHANAAPVIGADGVEQLVRSVDALMDATTVDPLVSCLTCKTTDQDHAPHEPQR